MKNLFIALAVIALVGASHAASINWTIGVPGKGADYANYRVYICENIIAFQSESQINDYLLGESVNTGTIKNNRGDGIVSGILSGLSNEKTGQIQDFSVVIVASDGSGYWTTTGTAQIYTTEITHSDYNLADASTMLATPSTAFGTSPVPEPTSGLMIFLGFCLMTLKRKRS